MKKFIAFLMALLMVASLAGCKSDTPEAVVVEADVVSGAETAETVGHRIDSLKYEGTVPATEGKDADGAEVVKATKEAVNGDVDGIGSTEPTTYGGNGADAVQPTEPTSDIGSSKPTEPTSDIGSSKPTEENGYEVIVNETEPTVPATEPTKPTGEDPAPTEPTKPSEPVKPTEPSADYSEPVDPSESETPTEPTDPCPDNPEEPTEHVHCWTCVDVPEEGHWVDAVQCTCGEYFEETNGVSGYDLWKAHVKSFSLSDRLNHYDCYDCSYYVVDSPATRYWWCPSCNTRSDMNPNP